jgi:4'-phosphopantetheinyl transferase
MRCNQSAVIELKNQVLLPELQIKLLASGEIHIWYASLDRPVYRFQELLSQDERDRARRFIFEQDRNHYIVSRGILRMLLGRYLGIKPDQVHFNYGSNAKPILAGTYDGIEINFNLSHSEEMAVYAFNSDHEIGIDIEKIRDIPDMEQIFERFFSPRENEVFHILSEGKRKEAFFNCWTRKEAFIKATGDGLSRPLNGFDVSMVPGEPARLLAIEGYSEEVSQWFLQDMKGIPEYAAALAIKSTCHNIRSWQWSDEL